MLVAQNRHKNQIHCKELCQDHSHIIKIQTMEYFFKMKNLDKMS